MEAIIALILIALAIYVIVKFVIPAVVAISGIAAVIIAGIAVLVGFCSAVSNYFSAIRHNLNFLHWEWEKDDEPARRSYFFGPGYAQLGATIKNAFELNAASGEKISTTGKSFKGDSTGIWGGVKSIGGFIYTVVGYICVYVIGMFLCAVLGLIHGSITTVVMILTYVIFTIVWIIDRIYLLKNKIRSDCPTCHSRFLIPTFMCPDCGAMHKFLVLMAFGNTSALAVRKFLLLS